MHRVCRVGALDRFIFQDCEFYFNHADGGGAIMIVGAGVNETGGSGNLTLTRQANVSRELGCRLNLLATECLGNRGTLNRQHSSHRIATNVCLPK